MPPIPADDRDSPVLGIALMVLAMAHFAVMDALAKVLTDSHAVIQIVFFRGLGALVVMTPLFLSQPAEARVLRRPGLTALRVGLGLSAVTLFFAALARMPMADVGAIAFSSPLMVAVLGMLVLKEWVDPVGWLALGLGFAGMLLILRPDGPVLSLGALYALGGTLGYALLMIVLRVQGRAMTSITSAFWFTALSPLVIAPLVPFFWTPPSGRDLVLLLGLGMIGAVGQLCLTQSLRLAPASVVAPFDYTYLIWALGLGWVLFGDWPAASTLAGLPLIVGAGLLILRRETVRGRR